MGKKLEDFFRCGGMDLLIFLGVIVTLTGAILLHTDTGSRPGNLSTQGSPALMSTAETAMQK